MQTIIIANISEHLLYARLCSNAFNSQNEPKK